MQEGREEGEKTSRMDPADCNHVGDKNGWRDVSNKQD